ncbi:MAG: hypothetical protein Q8O19_02085, partial [Rectinemataceae bacterium]|nr:hypothetical protein [Rectinemataceae bacterium]
MSAQDLQTVVLLERFVVPQGAIEVDGVHLKPEPANVFIKHLLSEAAQAFGHKTHPENVTPVPKSEQISDMLLKILTTVNSHSEALKTIPENKSDLKEVKGGLADLQTRVQNRRSQNNLVFARLREDIDHMSNKAKEAHIIFNGLTEEADAPIRDPEHSNHYCGIVGKFAMSIGLAGSLKRSFRINRYGGPIIEAIFDTPESANKFRKDYAALV